MKDVPQPATDPYSVGDEVMVYLAEDDPDGHRHGAEGVVVEVLEDSIGTETGRGMDSLSYQIETLDSIIDTWFRHSDLVPKQD